MDDGLLSERNALHGDGQEVRETKGFWSRSPILGAEIRAMRSFWLLIYFDV